MAIGASENPDRNDRFEALLTIKEVADLLKVSERHVQNLVRRGDIAKPVRFGRSTRFRPCDIRRLLNGDSDEGLKNQAI